MADARTTSLELNVCRSKLRFHRRRRAPLSQRDLHHPHNDFRDVLGSVAQKHPPIRKFKVKVVNANHPITRGVSDFIATDNLKPEQHTKCRHICRKTLFWNWLTALNRSSVICGCRRALIKAAAATVTPH
jgi:hypothetical protein